MDSILFWNAVALEANRVSHSDPGKREQTGPTLSSRALAIVHLAMYDAYAGTKGDPNFPRYLSPPPPPVGTSERNAVAGAAYTTLVGLYKTQKDFFEAQLSCFNTGNPSYDFGVAVGETLLNLRANDMDERVGGYIPSPKRGRHRVDPDNPGQNFYSPYYGAQTKNFAVTQRHGLEPPPYADGTDPKYLKSLSQVRSKGIRPDLTGTLPDGLFDDRRSALETLIGIYWAYEGTNRIGTPPRFYNQIIRLLAEEQSNNEGDNARLFAFVNAAMGDAGILAWEQKYCHDFWRPVLGVREHDETLGPLAPLKPPPIAAVDFNDGDPNWLPLAGPSTNMPDVKNMTPNFPAYPSGHATFGAAALHIARMFYGVAPDDTSDDSLLTGGVVSDELNGINRDNQGTVRPRHARVFPGGLWNMIIENATSRIYLGVHWIFDAFDFTEDAEGNLVHDLGNENVGGVGLGLRIARDIFAAGGGKAPQMTPDASAKPPIETPPVGSPMPTFPEQPASVGNCADAPSATEAGKTAKDEKTGAEAEEKRKVETPFLSGISRR